MKLQKGDVIRQGSKFYVFIGYNEKAIMAIRPYQGLMLMSSDVNEVYPSPEGVPMTKLIIWAATLERLYKATSYDLIRDCWLDVGEDNRLLPRKLY